MHAFTLPTHTLSRFVATRQRPATRHPASVRLCSTTTPTTGVASRSLSLGSCSSRLLSPPDGGDRPFHNRTGSFGAFSPACAQPPPSLPHLFWLPGSHTTWVGGLDERRVGIPYPTGQRWVRTVVLASRVGQVGREPWTSGCWWSVGYVAGRWSMLQECDGMAGGRRIRECVIRKLVSAFWIGSEDHGYCEEWGRE
jgi:hypothetical protein